MKLRHIISLSACIALCGTIAEAKSVRADDSAIRYVGRTTIGDDGSVTYDWSGTYFETVLSGGKLALRLSEKGESYYNVFVDGKQTGVVRTCGNDTIIDFVGNLSRKPHKIRIQKRTEGEFGRTTIHEFIIADKGGALAPVTDVPKRHIEIIGNSLTCGYGTEGKDHTEHFKTSTENCNLSYSTIVPRFFDADYTLIAHSGQGAVRNYGDPERTSKKGTMKRRMMQTFDGDTAQMWDFKNGYRPDLVIINLGANDFSTEPHPYRSEFIEAYKTILQQIRQGYGDIPVICFKPSMVTAPVFSYYQEAARDLGDSNIYVVEMKDGLLKVGIDYGSDWHPNYSGQRKIAMELIPLVSAIMNWEMPDKKIE